MKEAKHQAVRQETRRKEKLMAHYEDSHKRWKDTKTNRYISKPKHVQYASSDERDDAEETEEFIEKNRDRQIEDSKKQAEEQKKEQRIQELDRAIFNAEWAISNSRLDTATLKDYEVLLKKLKAERKTLK